ncbi:hypothetical protein CEF21_21515 [Bacillus sp. FJAT-42376]|uniref:glycosyltransferase n=1 Tax=Bacillus sp. FJAT-42376 TaxID=2014076 RepID=UPI000F4E83AB|nr:glycosyltransferase [Bacillus sp. FJAT-42376]AZB44660.1 hypothetical protein CEF21_21515 [Bacillus sp. FJAT-42376]
MRIAYYISDYGFGHASRSAAVIEELLLYKGTEITICHSFVLSFLKEILCGSGVRFRELQTDIGYVLKPHSLEPDVPALYKAYSIFMNRWEERVKEEVRFLKEEQIELVLSDISPIAFAAAAKAGVCSAGLSNFTWYTAYQGLILERDLHPLKQAYEKMDFFFVLAGSSEPEWGRQLDFGFFSRAHQQERVDQIHEHLKRIPSEKLIFFGLGMKIDGVDVRDFPLWDSPGCRFIVSSNVEIHHPNVWRIPEWENDVHHYIAAADLAITKAGWGTVAEAVCGRTPLLVIDRKSMKEDQNTIRYLKEKGLCRAMSWSELSTFTLSERDFTYAAKRPNEGKQLAAAIWKAANQFNRKEVGKR